MSFLLILGCGQMLPVLTTGVDLSVGSIIGIVSVLSALFSLKYGVLVGFGIAICVSIIIGLANGLAIGYVGVAPFAVTLGMLSMVHGLALIITSGQTIHGLPPEYMILGAGYIWKIPIPIIVSISLAAITWVLLYTTRFGRYMYAVGGDPESARLSGIDVRRYLMYAYIFSGFFAGICGVLLSSRVYSGTPNLGQAGLMLDSIAVVVIGGVTFSGGEGHLFGVILGVILIAILSNGFDLTGVSSFVKMVVTGAIICAAIIVDKYRKSS
jgi:ribose/xylose/arabinose/galactoside ABC-type transport system permease subunit